MFKKLMCCILLMVSFAYVLQAQQFNPAHGTIVDGKETFSKAMSWYKKVQTGTDSLYTNNQTTAISPVLVGASDSLFSDVYKNKGNCNMQVTLTGGSTVRTVVEVRGSNAPEYGSGVPAAGFKTMYWLKSGTGVTGSIVSTSLDSITAAGTSAPIIVPLLGARYFDVLVYTTAQQSGNTVVDIDLIMKEK